VIRHQPGVVLLDATATDLGIVRVLRRIRSNPSVVVTGDEFAAIAFLAGGADAYVLNPISVHVLKAQLRALERRKTSSVTTTLTVGDLRLDLAGRTAVRGETALDLSAREFDLLATLAFHAGRFVSRDKLLATIWRRPRGRADKILQFYLGELRRKLGETAASPRYLHATRGLGIKLVDPATAPLPQRRAACGRVPTPADGSSDELLPAAYG
jgi:DNA-binding response OmpR family regulator